jgi:protein gp37
MNKTGISWTDYSWNPASGCTPVSEGCAHCYAREWSKRWNRSFEVVLHPKKLDEPLRKNHEGDYVIPPGSKVFVNSMSDLFHEKVPFEFIDDVFGMMATRRDVTFQILTKRPRRMEEYLDWSSQEGGEYGGGDYSENIWLGVSIENNRHLTRLYSLVDIHLTGWRTFISFEPLLEDIRVITPAEWKFVDWIIVGGESGPHRRPFKVEWAYSLLEQARKQNVKFFFKQTGDLRPGSLKDVPEDLIVREFPTETELGGA